MYNLPELAAMKVVRLICRNKGHCPSLFVGLVLDKDKTVIIKLMENRRSHIFAVGFIFLKLKTFLGRK